MGFNTFRASGRRARRHPWGAQPAREPIQQAHTKHLGVDQKYNN